MVGSVGSGRVTKLSGRAALFEHIQSVRRALSSVLNLPVASRYLRVLSFFSRLVWEMRKVVWEMSFSFFFSRSDQFSRKLPGFWLRAVDFSNRNGHRTAYKTSKNASKEGKPGDIISQACLLTTLTLKLSNWPSKCPPPDRPRTLFRGPVPIRLVAGRSFFQWTGTSPSLPSHWEISHM